MPREMLMYRWFAKVYGWTPDQVRKLGIREYRWLPVIEQGEARATEMRQKEEQRAARRRAAGG